MKSRRARILLILAISLCSLAKTAGAQQDAGASRTVSNAQAGSEAAGPVVVQLRGWGKQQLCADAKRATFGFGLGRLR
jgi:hypothetical protein